MLFLRKTQVIIFLSICSGIILLSATLFGCNAQNTSTSHIATSSTQAPTQLVISTPGQQKAMDQVIQYDRLPDALTSPVQMTVDGQNVFVERYKDISYGRFAFTGTAHIAITATDAAGYSISPKRYNIQAQRQGNTLAFSLTAPHNLILQSGADKLFVFADAPEQDAPTADGSNVLNVTKYVTDTNGTTTQTANIQRAIDAASSTHSTVYFPSGKYISGMLQMRNDANIYLASGALLAGTGNALDTPGNFLQFKDVHNVRLYGHGAIDLHGMALRNSSGDAGRVKIIRTISATNIDIQDVMLRDSGSWTVHILGSDSVRITNLKIINDSANTNNDGIDPDGSSNVTVDGAFIYTTDDCFAVKTSGALHILQPTQNIMIQNSICYTKKSALKVGTETRAALSNITFDQNDVVHADRAIALYMADGALLNNVNYLNTSSEVIGGDSKQRLIDISISDRKGIGNIKNVTITNYTAYQFSSNNSVIAGMDNSIVDVTFKHLNVAGTLRNDASSAMITASDAQLNFAP
jgi:polygalacturonase